MHYLNARQGERDLVSYRGAFYLLATCDIPNPNEQDVEGVLGVDPGMVNLATDSDGESHSGSQIDRKRAWYARRRAALQAVGTTSANRRLKSRAGRQRRFQTNENHRISKQLVAKAKDTRRAIALEQLTGIRKRATVRKSQRARHSTWAFAQVRHASATKRGWLA